MDAQTLAELNNIRIRVDELLDKEALEYPVPALSIFIYNTLINEKARLLAVARAAADIGHDICEGCDCANCDTQRVLQEALAAVEDLL